MPTLEARGVELAWSERGEGAPVLLIHETAATGAVWEPVAAALSGRARAIVYDRRGWGASSAPDDYRRTTVEEQSEDAAALLEIGGGRPGGRLRGRARGRDRPRSAAARRSWSPARC